MRNLKKFLALVLAFMMVMSLMVTVNAATTNVVYGDNESVTDEFVEDLTVLSGMGVIKGYDDGTFLPGREINRGQMAAIIYRITTGDVTDSRADYWIGYNPFPDVHDDDYYAGYIGYCASAGYIQGFPDGTFKPMNNVTGYQALAMILRAMGYNHSGDNFTGDNWQSDVSSRARQNNMLVNIQKTIYNNTFGKAATRELVAEMTFQGLVNPQVVWTTAFGYQQYGMDGGVLTQKLNPTLGEEYFGLTHHKGVIVGNASTGEGESVTKIGFSLNESGAIDNNLGIRPVYDNGSDAADPDDDNLLGYSSAYVYNNGAYNETRSFKWDTTLSDFGHAVDVWYNIDTLNGPTTTYAVFDRNVSSEVVALPAAATGDASIATTGANTLGKAADDEGFKFRSVAAIGGTRGTPSAAGNAAYLNYSFARTENEKFLATDTDFQSPVLETNSTNPHQMYLLISNTTGNVLDMVVALDLTVTQITQQNNTKDPYTVGVYNGNMATSPDGTNIYFGDTTDEGAAPSNTYVNMAQKNLVGDSLGTSMADLGKKVVAVEITGTTGDNDGYTSTAAGNATPPATLTSTYYYNLKEITNVQRKTVIKVDNSTQEVFFNDGTSYKRSDFALATDATFLGSDAANQVKAPLVYDTYDFYLDARGEYIFWEPISGSSEFVYATYLDYTSPLNSSSYTYSITTVNENGEGKVIKTPVISYVPFDGTNVLAKVNFTNNNQGYANNLLPKSDTTLVSGTVQLGRYIGYIIDSEGNLTQVTPAGVTGSTSGTVGNPMVQASSNDFDNGSNVTIGSRDVTVGAKEVQNALFLTNNTKIYLVSGAGTDNQKVVPYNGIDELLGDNAQVIIHSDDDVTTYPGNGTPFPFDSTLGQNPLEWWEMIYFKQSPFTYAQDYATSAYQVDVVYIPADCVEFVGKTNGDVYFVGDSSSTLINATGNQATQFTMYDLQGNEVSRWIDGLYTDSTPTDSYTIAQNGDNVFYKLVETGKTANDNQPIYKLTTFDGKGVIGQYWTGAATANSNMTVAGTPGTDFAQYQATTRNSQSAFIDDASSINGSSAVLYNVGDAKVVNLDKDTYPGIVDGNLATLNEAGSIYNNETVPVSCVLNADNNAIVDVIFVNA